MGLGISKHESSVSANRAVPRTLDSALGTADRDAESRTPRPVSRGVVMVGEPVISIARRCSISARSKAVQSNSASTRWFSDPRSLRGGARGRFVPIRERTDTLGPPDRGFHYEALSFNMSGHRLLSSLETKRLPLVRNSRLFDAKLRWLGSL